MIFTNIYDCGSLCKPLCFSLVCEMSDSLVVSDRGNCLASGCEWALLTVKNPPNVDDFFILKISD